MEYVSLNAGIGFGGIVGGLVMSHLSVQAVTYTSAIIGLLGLIVVITLKNIHYAKIKTGTLMNREMSVPVLFVYKVDCVSR